MLLPACSRTSASDFHVTPVSNVGLHHLAEILPPNLPSSQRLNRLAAARLHAREVEMRLEPVPLEEQVAERIGSSFGRYSAPARPCCGSKIHLLLFPQWAEFRVDESCHCCAASLPQDGALYRYRPVVHRDGVFERRRKQSRGLADWRQLCRSIGRAYVLHLHEREDFLTF